MFAVLIPVGPGQEELARLDDTIDSLRAFESPSDIHLLLVDDNRHRATWRRRSRMSGHRSR
jgi:hypothetical protein